jgi:hypothetical protein
VAGLEAVIRDGGIKLFAVIDQSGEAAAGGLELRDTQLVASGAGGPARR